MKLFIVYKHVVSKLQVPPLQPLNFLVLPGPLRLEHHGQLVALVAVDCLPSSNIIE